MGSIFKDMLTMGSYSASKKYATEAQAQAKRQEEMYNQQIREQKEAAILKGSEISEAVANINVGGGDTYVDDPYARRKLRRSVSGTLGL